MYLTFSKTPYLLVGNISRSIHCLSRYTVQTNMVATSTIKTRTTECLSELVKRHYDPAWLERGE